MPTDPKAAVDAAADKAATDPAPDTVTKEDLAALEARVATLEEAPAQATTLAAEAEDLVARLLAFDARAAEHNCSVLELLAVTARNALGVDLREPPVEVGA